MKKFFIRHSFFLLFCFSLNACVKPYPVYETNIHEIKAPQFLLEPLPIPPFIGETNEDLLLYTLSLEENLSLCNARLHAIKMHME